MACTPRRTASSYGVARPHQVSVGCHPSAGVAQWQSPSLPSWSCGFDSRHPLHMDPPVFGGSDQSRTQRASTLDDRWSPLPTPVAPVSFHVEPTILHPESRPDETSATAPTAEPAATGTTPSARLQRTVGQARRLARARGRLRAETAGIADRGPRSLSDLRGLRRTAPDRLPGSPGSRGCTVSSAGFQLSL